MGENLIHVGDLAKRAGSHKNVHLVIEDQEFKTKFAKVINEVTCDFSLESITNGIVIRGVITGNYEAECGYGLENFVESFSYNVNELFEQGHKLSLAKKKSIKHDNFALADENDGEEDLYSFQGADIDITQLVIDTILTNLPITPKCSHGPANCNVCSIDVLPYLTNEEMIEQDKINDSIKETRSKWAALDSMFESLEQENLPKKNR